VRTHEDFEFESSLEQDDFVPPEDEMDVEDPAGARIAVDLAAFVCELAMLALLAVAGWGPGDGGLMGIALAAFYPALVIVIWSFWVAPKAKHRLGDPWRLLLQIGLFAATGLALASLAWITSAAVAYAVLFLGGGAFVIFEVVAITVLQRSVDAKLHPPSHF